ncbi:MAG: NAD-dependent epimerase/dehydratase family protein [Promethearchaeota archaeon]
MNFDSKKIIITGGTGFLGANLVEYLVKQENVPPSNIRVLHLPGTSTAGIDDLPGIELVEGNLLDRPSVFSALEGCNLVFHVAGDTTFDPFKRERQWMVNVEGTWNILDACLESDTVERVLYTSTVNTLGAPSPAGTLGDENTSPYDEETRGIHSFSTPEGILQFAREVHEGRAGKKWWKRIKVGYFDSKLAAQEIVNHHAKDRDLDVVSVLPGTFFGPRDTFIGGGIYILRVYNNAIPGFLKTGSPFVHVEDVVRGHVLVMKDGKKGGRYIINGNEEDNMYMDEILGLIAEVISEEEPEREIKRSWKKLSFRIAKFGAVIAESWSAITKSPCLLSRAAIRAASTISFYSHRKARDELGFSPVHSVKEAIRDHFRYFKEKGMLDLKGRG